MALLPNGATFCVCKRCDNRSSVLAGTLLSTYLYTGPARQWSEAQTQRPNEHGSQATFSYLFLTFLTCFQWKHRRIWQALTWSTSFMQNTIHSLIWGNMWHWPLFVNHLNATVVEHGVRIVIFGDAPSSNICIEFRRHMTLCLFKVSSNTFHFPWKRKFSFFSL